LGYERQPRGAHPTSQVPKQGAPIRCFGKLPRKAGLILVRHGEQYELTLQAETFAVSGAKIQVDEDAEGRGIFASTGRGPFGVASQTTRGVGLSRQSTHVS
jgi:hypothetical protein